jgi:hypothetical protein
MRIEFAETKLSSEFFNAMDEIFRAHGLTPEDKMSVCPPKPELAYTIERSDLLNQLPGLRGGRLTYVSSKVEDLYVSVFTEVSPGQTSRFLLMTAPIEQRQAYTEKEKARILKIESITLQLHQRLNAIDSQGQDEYSETPWFHFSKEEWKTTRDLPICEDY